MDDCSASHLLKHPSIHQSIHLLYLLYAHMGPRALLGPNPAAKG